MSNNSIWPRDRTLSGVSTPGSGSNGNERVFCIPRGSSITGASPSNCLVSYPGPSFGSGVLPLCRGAWVQILDETDCISHSTNTLWKGMNPIILPPAMGK